jgi:zinc D-Ala-D-Ala carboxypeptidase
MKNKRSTPSEERISRRKFLKLALLGGATIITGLAFRRGAGHALEETDMMDALAESQSIDTLLPADAPAAPTPVPACTYATLPAAFYGYDDWQRTLVDTSYHLPPSYEPPDLVSVSEAGFRDNRQIRSLVIADLQALREAADTAGNPLAILSVYRSYSYQESTFASWVARHGVKRARLVSARAGHSEHQLGTAIDFGSQGAPASWDLEDWAQLPAGAWMKANAWRYGFIMSYPKDSLETTCYIYEPWHYRYMGRELAAEIQYSGLTLREWLWQKQPT